MFGLDFLWSFLWSWGRLGAIALMGGATSLVLGVAVLFYGPGQPPALPLTIVIFGISAFLLYIATLAFRRWAEALEEDVTTDRRL